jgi:hypothetical protein
MLIIIMDNWKQHILQTLPVKKKNLDLFKDSLSKLSYYNCKVLSYKETVTLEELDRFHTQQDENNYRDRKRQLAGTEVTFYLLDGEITFRLYKQDNIINFSYDVQERELTFALVALFHNGEYDLDEIITTIKKFRPDPKEIQTEYLDDLLTETLSNYSNYDKNINSLILDYIF